MTRYLPVLILLLTFLNAGTSHGGGIPHPSFQLFGSVDNHGDGFRRALGAGEVEFVFESEHGTLNATAAIHEGGGDVHYVVDIPKEIGKLYFPAAGNVVDLGQVADQIWLVSESITITVNGEIHQARWEREAATDLLLKRDAWGGAQRLDLIVETSMFDHDGDGIPEHWEPLYPGAGEDLVGGDGGSSGSGDPVGGYDPEADLVAAEATVHVKSGVTSVLRIPLSSQQPGPLEADAVVYAIETLPPQGQLVWVNPVDGMEQDVTVGAEFSELDLIEGRLRYLAPALGVSPVSFEVTARYQENSPQAATVELILWEPPSGTASGAALWVDALRQAGMEPEIGGLRNQAAEGDEVWPVTHGLTLSGEHQVGFSFDDVGATAPSGTLGSAALGGNHVEIMAAFAGDRGAILGSPSVGLEVSRKEYEPLSLIRFGSASSGVAQVLREEDSVEVVHAWRQSEEMRMASGRPASGLGFVPLHNAAMGDRTTIGFRVDDEQAVHAPWEGRLHELLVYPRKLGELERARLRAYLLAKWGGDDYVVVDATHANGPVVQHTPADQGDGSRPHLFLGWQSETTLVGSDNDDLFLLGGGKHSIWGGQGANRFVFLLEGGQEHVIYDFVRRKDVLDLSSLFREPMAGPVTDYLRATRDGDDSILEVHRAGAGSVWPSLTIRFANWSGLTPERLAEFLASGVIEAGEVQVLPEVEFELVRANVEETGTQPAHIRLHFHGDHLRTGAPIPLPVQSALAQAGEDFEIRLTQYDEAAGEWVTLPLAEAPLRIPPSSHPRVDILIDAAPNDTTDPARPVSFALLQHPAFYILPEEDSQATIQILDGLPLVRVEALAEHAGPASPTAFLLSREGPLDQSLSVQILMEGTALNGTDYQYIGSTAAFSAGEASIDIDLVPLREVPSTDQDRVVMRVETGDSYQVAGSQTAQVILQASAKDVRSEVARARADAVPGGNGAQYLIFRRSPLLADELLAVTLQLQGNVPLYQVEIEARKPNGSTSTLLPNAADEVNLFLMPGESFAFLTFTATSPVASGAGAHYLEAVMTLESSSDYEVVAPGRFTIFFEETLNDWAARQGWEEDDLMEWLTTPGAGGGLTPLEAYAFGLAPGTPRDALSQPLLSADGDEFMLQIPFFDGAGGVAPVLERSEDMIHWSTATNFTFLRNEQVDGRFFRVYSGPQSGGEGFYRLRLQVINP